MDIGVNLSGISYYVTGMPFNNIMKISPGWFRPWGSSWKDIPLDLDENGYLKSSDEGQAQTIIHDDKWGRLPEDDSYVLLYDGEGKLEFNLNKPDVIDSKPGRIEIKLPKGRMGLKQLSTEESDPLRNIRLIPKKFEASYEGNEIREEFLQLLEGVRVIRYMQQQAITKSKEVSWDDRKSGNYFGVSGRSIEDTIKIANKSNSYPWISTPHLADDNYIKKLATYVRDNLNSDLKIYIEYSNEAWNYRYEVARYLGKRTITNMLRGLGKCSKFGKTSFEMMTG
jgi:hypothetical protein